MSRAGIVLLVFAIATVVGACSVFNKSNAEWASITCDHSDPYACGAVDRAAREERATRKEEESARRLAQQKSLVWTGMTRAVTLENYAARSAERAGSPLSALDAGWCDPAVGDLYEVVDAIAISALGDNRITITYVADPYRKPHIERAMYAVTSAGGGSFTVGPYGRFEVRQQRLSYVPSGKKLLPAAWAFGISTTDHKGEAKVVCGTIRNYYDSYYSQPN